MPSDEYQPGERAPRSARYQEVNIFGTPTGKVAYAVAGAVLPFAPHGFAWRPLRDQTAAELRARADEYRRMAETATTAPVRTGLRKIADRLAAMADDRERNDGGKTP